MSRCDSEYAAHLATGCCRCLLSQGNVVDPHSVPRQGDCPLAYRRLSRLVLLRQNFADHTLRFTNEQFVSKYFGFLQQLYAYSSSDWTPWLATWLPPKRSSSVTVPGCMSSTVSPGPAAPRLRRSRTAFPQTVNFLQQVYACSGFGCSPWLVAWLDCLRLGLPCLPHGWLPGWAV